MIIKYRKKIFLGLMLTSILLFFSVLGLLCEENKQQIHKVRNNYISVGANYFSPSEKSFRDMYGEGVTFGGEVNIRLWRVINIWILGNYYFKKGELPFTKEPTRMTLVPIGIGLKLMVQRNVFNPYIGLGPVFYIYKEKNPIGTANGIGIGIMGDIGCYFRITGGFLIDTSVNYSYCEARPQNIKADLGGIQAGIGLGYAF